MITPGNRTRWVTKTGRSLPIGKTTRRNKQVKRPSVKPLPLHLQCHPQKRERLPLHPDCATSRIPSGYVWDLQVGMSLLFGMGYGLNESGPVRVEVADHGTWYADDTVYAFAWKQAAERSGYKVAVYPATKY